MEYCYVCVIDRADTRIMLSVFTEREVSADELLPLAIAKAIEHDAMLGINAEADDYQPIGFSLR
ncbi:hypothetical protein D3C81_938150 [compost metagenome]